MRQSKEVNRVERSSADSTSRSQMQIIDVASRLWLEEAQCRRWWRACIFALIGMESGGRRSVGIHGIPLKFLSCGSPVMVNRGSRRIGKSLIWLVGACLMLSSSLLSRLVYNDSVTCISAQKYVMKVTVRILGEGH